MTAFVSFHEKSGSSPEKHVMVGLCFVDSTAPFSLTSLNQS